MNFKEYFSAGILLICITTVLFSSCKSDQTPKPKSEAQTSAAIIETGDAEIDFLTKALSNNSLDDELRFKRAEKLYDKGLYNEAIADLKVAITVDSMQPQYYHLLSDVFLDDNNSSKAIQTMKVAANLFPERIPTLLKLSETHYLLKQYQESMSALNNISRFDNQNAEAYFMIGLNFREMGDIKRAMAALQSATEFDSKLTDAWLVLGDLLREQNNPRALQYYTNAVSIDPENINALHSLAYFKQDNEDVEGALDLYKSINKIDRYYIPAYLNAGILHLERSEYTEAMEQFDIIVKQQPQNPKGHYFKAEVLFALGDKEGAKVSVNNALSLDPDYQKANELINKLK